MYKNYFYLRRSVFELNQLLVNTRIIDVYSQEKDILYLHIPTYELPNRHLLISTNPQFSYLQIRNNHNKAKKNVIQIFPQIISSEINNIKISDSDRIVKIELNKGFLIFSVRGNKTNIHFILNTIEKTFKRSDKSIISELEGIVFVNSIDYDIDIHNTELIEDIIELKKIFPMISSEIKKEILYRESNSQNSIIIQIFADVVNDILKADIRVSFNNELNKVILYPITFNSILTEPGSKEFNNFNLALNHYISTYFQTKSVIDTSTQLEKYFEREMSSLTTKINRLNKRVEEGSKEQLYSEFGSILLTNIYKIKKGMKDYRLTEKDSEIVIKLDPKLNAKQNIDKYFDKSRDEKVNFNKSIDLLNMTKNKYEDLENEYNLFRNTKSTSGIEEIAKRVLPKKEKIIKMDSGLKFKYWHYLIEDEYHVYVGRDSKSNDYLSVKFAKQNDYWFHARGMPGSHVVLKVENVKEGVPNNILKKAASIAAFHSKAKTAGTVPVSYTVAKYVYKKKGLAPGKVFLTKEKSFLVKPEIPKNCNLINE